MLPVGFSAGGKCFNSLLKARAFWFWSQDFGGPSYQNVPIWEKGC